MRNLIKRETVLNVLDNTEDDLNEGLSITAVLPLFKKYKPKLTST